MNILKTKLMLLFCIISVLIGIKTQASSTENLKIDSLINKINQATEDTTKVNLYNNLSSELYRIDFGKSRDYAHKAFELATSIDYKKGIIKSLFNVGYAQEKIGDYKDAIASFYDAKKIADELNHQELIADCYESIATTYYLMKDIENAENNYLLALEIYKNIGDNLGYITALMNYSNTKSYEDKKRLQLLMEALQYAGNIDNLQKISSIYTNIANYHYYHDENEQALDYYNRSYGIKEKLNDIAGQTTLLISMGSLYATLKNFKLSDEMIEKAIQFSIDLNDKRLENKAYEAKIENLILQNNFKEAYAYSAKINEITIQLFKESNSREIGKIEAKYELEKKIMEEERLEEEKRKKQELLKERKDNLQYSGIFIFIILLFLMLPFIKSKVNISPRVAEGLIFFAFLLFFEFCLVLLDPYIDEWSSGEPAFKLLFNAVLAGGIFPLHAFFENKLKRVIIRNRVYGK
jgi:two-component system, NarL family, sensor histidine kinase BarA